MADPEYTRGTRLAPWNQGGGASTGAISMVERDMR